MSKHARCFAGLHAWLLAWQAHRELLVGLSRLALASRRSALCCAWRVFAAAHPRGPALEKASVFAQGAAIRRLVGRWRKAAFGVRREQPTPKVARELIVARGERKQRVAALCFLHAHGKLVRPTRRVRQLVSRRRLSDALSSWQTGHRAAQRRDRTRSMGVGRGSLVVARRAVSLWRSRASVLLRTARATSIADNFSARSGAWRRGQLRFAAPAALRRWSRATGSAARSPRARAIPAMAAWRMWTKWTFLRLSRVSLRLNAEWCLAFCAIQRGFGSWSRLLDASRAASSAARAADAHFRCSSLRRWRHAALEGRSLEVAQNDSTMQSVRLACATALRRWKASRPVGTEQAAYARAADGACIRLRQARAVRSLRGDLTMAKAITELKCVARVRWLAACERATFRSWRVAASCESKLRAAAAGCAAGRDRREARSLWAAFMEWTASANMRATLETTSSHAHDVLTRRRRRVAFWSWSEPVAARSAVGHCEGRTAATLGGMRSRRAMRKWAVAAAARRAVSPGQGWPPRAPLSDRDRRWRRRRAAPLQSDARCNLGTATPSGPTPGRGLGVPCGSRIPRECAPKSFPRPRCVP